MSWDVGTGWVGSHAWCNMESCSGKVQEKGMCEMKVQGQFSGVSLGALVQDGLAQMRGVTWRAVTSKSCLFDMPMLKALAFAMPTRQ